MKQIETERKQTKPSQRFMDVSRFTRLINNIDQKDKDMNPEKRKRKWFFVLAGLFLLYLVSFLFPAPKLSRGSIGPVQTSVPSDSVLDKTGKNQKSMTFEMPVDSFENILKKQIHEKLPEKK